MTYLVIYKIGGLCLNMRYMVMTQETNKIYTYQIKHEFAKKCLRHNLPLLLNNLPEKVKQKLMSHSNQGFVNYVKLYFLQSYEDTRQNCYVCMQN